MWSDIMDDHASWALVMIGVFSLAVTSNYAMVQWKFKLSDGRTAAVTSASEIHSVGLHWGTWSRGRSFNEVSMQVLDAICGRARAKSHTWCNSMQSIHSRQSMIDIIATSNHQVNLFRRIETLTSTSSTSQLWVWKGQTGTYRDQRLKCLWVSPTSISRFV